MVLRLYVHIDETQSLFLAFDLYIILYACNKELVTFQTAPNSGQQVFSSGFSGNPRVLRRKSRVQEHWNATFVSSCTHSQQSSTGLVQQ